MYGGPLRDFFVFVQFLFGFNFDFQAMVCTDPEKFALVEIFIEKGRSYVRFVRRVRRQRGRNAQIPIEQTLKKWIGRLRETGSAQSRQGQNQRRGSS